MKDVAVEGRGVNDFSMMSTNSKHFILDEEFKMFRF